MKPDAKKMTVEDAVALVRPRDTVASGLATGQAVTLLEALGKRDDLEYVRLYLGLMIWPYSLLLNRNVHVLSGFFGPIERDARAKGCNIEYVCEDFIGLERLGLRLKPRVMFAPTTMPDENGFLNFGLHSGATTRPFMEAAADPQRLAIAEANPRMPRVAGLPDHGFNRIHIAEIDGWVESETSLTTLPNAEASPEEIAIADFVAAEIEDGANLQFGIGAIPNEIARILANSRRGDFGIHTEMISDGVMHLHESGKVRNHHTAFENVTVATFALGSQALYDWLDDNPVVRMLPVSAVNDPAVVAKMEKFVSVNGALAVDILGQAAADYVGGKQYSGVGGHELFVSGAGGAPQGKSFLCLKSTATVAGARRSTIVAHFGAEIAVTTPRHHVQYVVTEHGVAYIEGKGDRERAHALVEIAHPDYREELRRAIK